MANDWAHVCLRTRSSHRGHQEAMPRGGLAALRAARGEERIHYYGVSYGTYLGAT